MKTIRLFQPHTHEGVNYIPPPEGIQLSVNDADAALLDAWGLTTPPPKPADTMADTASDAPLTRRPDRRARVAIPADPAPTVDAAVDASSNATPTRTV